MYFLDIANFLYLKYITTKLRGHNKQIKQIITYAIKKITLK